MLIATTKAKHENPGTAGIGNGWRGVTYRLVRRRLFTRQHVNRFVAILREWFSLRRTLAATPGLLMSLTLALATTSVVAQEGSAARDADVAKGPSTLPQTLPDMQPRSNSKALSNDWEYWASQLSSDHYLRRESAQQHLIRGGMDAVPALEKAIEQGDLETIELSIRALGEIAMAQPPNDEMGAWAVLQRIASTKAGSKASRAKLVSDEIGEFRSDKAREALLAAGVYIGVDSFVVQAISIPRTIVQLDPTWKGKIESLDWLRWLRDIKFARLRGDAVRQDVIDRLVLMPDLNTLAIVDGSLDAKMIDSLATMKSIQALEIRYVKLTPELSKKIAKLPLRSSLSLIGTGLKPEDIDAMRERLAGLKIEYKQGGYLGVSGSDGFQAAQLSTVLPNSAAELAGLRGGDVILKIDEVTIRRFSDLQAKVSQHFEGDVLRVEYLRGANTHVTEVTLGKQLE